MEGSMLEAKYLILTFTSGASGFCK